MSPSLTVCSPTSRTPLTYDPLRLDVSVTTQPDVSCLSVAWRREILRSVSRTVFSSPRPIVYSSRTSGSGVRLPSSSSIVSFHIPRRLKKPGARSSQDSTIRSVYRSPTLMCNEAFQPPASEAFSAISVGRATLMKRTPMALRARSEDTYLVVRGEHHRGKLHEHWLGTVAWGMT